MKKLISLVLALVLVLALAGCAGNNAETQGNQPATTQAPATEATETQPPVPVGVEPADIESAVASVLGEGYLATEPVTEDALASTPLAWIEDLSILESWVAKQAAVTAVNPDTVVVVKCKDAADAEQVVKCFNDCLAQTVNYVRMYNFGMAKVEGTRIYRVDDLVMYILVGTTDESGDAEAQAALVEADYHKIDLALETILGTLPENEAVIPEATGNGGFGFGG